MTLSIYTFFISIALISLTLVSSRRLRMVDKILSPPILVNAFVLLYAIIGFELYWKGSYYILGGDFSPSLPYIYTAINIFIMTFTLSYIIFYKLSKPNDKKYAYTISWKKLLAISAPFFIYIPFTFSGDQIPVVDNIIILLFNSLIFLLGYALITKTRMAIVLSFILAALIAYIGFRYRLALLLLPIIFYKIKFDNGKNYKSLKSFAILTAALFSIAIIGVTRNYSSGLDFSYAKDFSLLEILIVGIFNDTSTLIASGALMQEIDNKNLFAYHNQINYILNYFLPNELIGKKTYSPIFDYVSILTNQNRNESGQAVMGFAEYYHTAGYLGVLVFALLFSFIFANLYKKAIVTGRTYQYYLYFAFITLLLNSFTRGYFPQNVQDLISGLIGFYLIRKISIKSVVSG